MGRRLVQFIVAVSLTNSSLELEFARRLLVLGIECSWPPWRKRGRNEVCAMRGRRCRLRRDCWGLWIRDREAPLRFVVHKLQSEEEGEAGRRPGGPVGARSNRDGVR